MVEVTRVCNYFWRENKLMSIAPQCTHTVSETSSQAQRVLSFSPASLCQSRISCWDGKRGPAAVKGAVHPKMYSLSFSAHADGKSGDMS